MKLRLELFSKDLEKTVQFYQEIIGLKLNRMDQTYAELVNETVEIGVGSMEALPDAHPLKAKNTERFGIGVEIVIEIPDLEERYQKVLELGYPIESHLTKQYWGSSDFRLLDPNGYYIRITEV